MIQTLKPIPLCSSRRDLFGTYMEVVKRSYELFYMIFTSLIKSAAKLLRDLFRNFRRECLKFSNFAYELRFKRSLYPRDRGEKTLLNLKLY